MGGQRAGALGPPNNGLQRQQVLIPRVCKCDLTGEMELCTVTTLRTLRRMIRVTMGPFQETGRERVGAQTQRQRRWEDKEELKMP